MSAAFAAPAAPLPARSSNPFEAARLKLIAGPLALKAPAAYPSYPLPSDHEGVLSHLREVVAIVDEWHNALGFQLSDNAVTAVDMRSFEGAFSGAIEDNATWQFEREAETLREYSAERRASRRA